jgi:heat shock transcription factor, other eukaryote
MQNPYSNITGDQMMRWGGGADGSGRVDGLPDDMAPIMTDQFGLVPAQGQYIPGVPMPTNSLARRQNNRALVPTVPRANFDPNDQWGPLITDDTSLIPQPSNGNMAEHDSIEVLEEQAQKAKREAQSKRKQIPPFVQKLSRLASLRTRFFLSIRTD